MVTTTWHQFFLHAGMLPTVCWYRLTMTLFTTAVLLVDTSLQFILTPVLLTRRYETVHNCISFGWHLDTSSWGAAGSRCTHGKARELYNCRPPIYALYCSTGYWYWYLVLVPLVQVPVPVQVPLPVPVLVIGGRGPSSRRTSVQFIYTVVHRSRLVSSTSTGGPSTSSGTCTGTWTTGVGTSLPSTWYKSGPMNFMNCTLVRVKSLYTQL